MSTDTSIQGGVDRTHGRSLAQKTVFFLGHGILVLICAWLALGGGAGDLGSLFGQDWVLSDPSRAVLLLACAALYWLRHGVTLFYLLVRRVDWGEVFGLLGFIGFIEVGFLLAGGNLLGSDPLPLGPPDLAAVALVLAGSLLNTVSEVQRKLWKRDPANRGRCYTGGLFRHSMHINYFGDTVMFTGWALLTAVSWALLLPALMAAMFLFYHIPALDQYLAQRYPEDFPAYAQTTKKFIPYIY